MRVAPLVRAIAVVVSCTLAGAACGRGAGDRSRAGDTAAAGGSGGDASEPLALTGADLEAYERGLAAEIELVLAADERERVATTPEARGQAAQARWETATMPEAARKIGVAAERYRRIRQTVDRVLQDLSFQGKIEGPVKMDTTAATAQMRERLRRDPYSGLPPASAAALKARLDRIVPLWSRYVSMTAVAG